MRESMVAGLVVAASLMSFVSEARAERYIIVNGQRMTLAQIVELERIACTPIPNGNYWLNAASGVWGYAGNPRPQGNIRDGCYRSVRRPSLSERGMLFSTHDWVR